MPVKQDVQLLQLMALFLSTEFTYVANGSIQY